MMEQNWKKERSCPPLELWRRKLITSLFYWRGYRKLYPGKPFFTPGAIKFLEKRLNKSANVFEYGSGQSSYWYARRVRTYIAVEHDRKWFERVVLNLKKELLVNARIIYKPTNNELKTFSWEQEWKYFEILKHPPSRPEFKNYMAAIDEFPDQSFDYISIDGRERIGCLVHAIPKLAENGLLIIDDSMRPRYREAFDILADWYVKKYDFGLNQTSIFARKKTDF